MVPLYDMGSAGIPDRVLLKPARLTAEEQAIMRTHTQIGYTAIAHAQKQFSIHSPLLELAKEITLSHHERWNGSGYPNGLAGADIPLSARLMAIADVYDALISSKVYKAGISHTEAVHIIFSERAAHFDPDMVDTFIEIQDSFAAIALRYADTEADMQHKINYMANAIAESAS
jgi:putative two-component system response regulator